MAKLPEGVFWQDVQAGDTLVAAAMMGDSVEIGFDGWLPSGTKVDSGFAALRIGSGSILAGLDGASGNDTRRETKARPPARTGLR